jgi:hypothetical protein
MSVYTVHFHFWRLRTHFATNELPAVYGLFWYLTRKLCMIRGIRRGAGKILRRLMSSKYACLFSTEENNKRPKSVYI